jgi:hypothetical protein
MPDAEVLTTLEQLSRRLQQHRFLVLVTRTKSERKAELKEWLCHESKNIYWRGYVGIGKSKGKQLIWDQTEFSYDDANRLWKLCLKWAEEHHLSKKEVELKYKTVEEVSSPILEELLKYHNQLKGSPLSSA